MTMIKQIFLLAGIFAVVLFRPGTDRVSITQTVPASVHAGGDFELEIEISKAGISGYGKAQTTLPNGFVATDYGTKGALLRQDDNVLKLIWMELPQTDLFTARCKVLLDPSIQPGDYTFVIRFSYLDGNEKRSVLGTPVHIKVLPPTSDMIAQLKAEEERSKPQIVKTELLDSVNKKLVGIGVSCSLSSERKSETEQVVNVKISKGELRGFGKVEVPVCDGIIATNLENEGGVFSFTGGKVKYVWTSMPDSPDLDLSFKLIRSPASKWISACSVDGEFSFLEKDESKKCRMNSVNLNYVPDDVYARMESARKEEKALAKTETEQKPADVIVVPDSNLVTEIAKTATPESTGTAAASKVQENINKEKNDEEARAQNVVQPAQAEVSVGIEQKVTAVQDSANVKQSVAVEVKKEAESPFQTVENKVQEQVAKSESKISEPIMDVKKEEVVEKASTDKVKSSVSFKVQVCATHRDITAVSIQSFYKLQEEVFQEMHEGWFKFTVGGFSQYSEARTKRESLGSYNLPGPFVTAYNAGVRITVQEALMITRQTWVK
ncbi:MAG: hypothetical protein RLZZ46_1167 [Bacteroidota bacterium]